MWYLGDFGWAVMRDDLSMQNPDGAGSLWYAPPELNPPVEGVFCKPGALFWDEKNLSTYHRISSHIYNIYIYIYVYLFKYTHILSV